MEVDNMVALVQMQRFIRELHSSSRSHVPEEKMLEFINDERMLQKWLHASKLNTARAAHSVLSSMQWKLRKNVDQILETNYIERLRPNFPVHFGSVDNAKRPVVYIPLNHWNFEHLPESDKQGDFKRFVVCFFEHAMKEIKVSNTKRGSRILEFSVIINVDGVSAWKLLKREVFKQLSLFSKIYHYHYPGTLLRCIVINCASTLEKKILHCILRPSIWRKCQTPSVLQLYLQENPNWNNVLCSVIPSEQLPVEFGGWKQLSEDVVDNDSITELS